MTRPLPAVSRTEKAGAASALRRPMERLQHHATLNDANQFDDDGDDGSAASGAVAGARRPRPLFALRSVDAPCMFQRIHLRPQNLEFQRLLADQQLEFSNVLVRPQRAGQ
jgi:hypothetical protein